MRVPERTGLVPTSVAAPVTLSMVTSRPAFAARPQSAYSHRHYEFRTDPYGRRGRGGRFRETQDSYAYENEDQSAIELRPGIRVRHPQFGVGTVVAVEEHTDDLKITVRFNAVGVKKLLAKFAKLELA